MAKRSLEQSDFLGSGWRYPLSEKDGAAISKREKSIRESIRIILGTAKGERVMRPDFGCDIHKFVFDPNNGSTRFRIASMVKQALAKWEPRIKVLEVNAYPDAEEGNKLLVDIDYLIIQKNTAENLVYPFYIK